MKSSIGSGSSSVHHQRRRRRIDAVRTQRRHGTVKVASVSVLQRNDVLLQDPIQLMIPIRFPLPTVHHGHQRLTILNELTPTTAILVAVVFILAHTARAASATARTGRGRRVRLAVFAARAGRTVHPFDSGSPGGMWPRGRFRRQDHSDAGRVLQLSAKF